MTFAEASAAYLADLEARHAQVLAYIRHIANLEVQHVMAWTGGDTKGDAVLAKLRCDRQAAEADAELLEALLAECY